MPTPVSELRLREHARTRLWLVIDGLPVSFTDDQEGQITGSGATSWIGQHELASAWETVGAREVRPGLEVPRSITTGINEKTGLPDSQQLVTFKVLDIDEDLVRLFATEGKLEGANVLNTRIAPGTTPLPDAIAVTEPPGTANPRGRHIGAEHIGPLGERRRFHCFPIEGIGYEHHGAPAVLAPTVISDEPIVFAGRQVALYRIYHDPDATIPHDWRGWPAWAEQFQAGNLVWWGELRDAGRIVDGKVWEIDCYGEGSLLKRRCGVQLVSPEIWLPLSAPEGAISLQDHERWISVMFKVRRFNSNNPILKHEQGFDAIMLYDFKGSAWDRQVVGSTLEDIRAEIHTIIQEAADGSNINYDPFVPDAGVEVQGALHDHPGLDAGFNIERQFYVTKNDHGVVDLHKANAGLEMHIAMHRKLWAVFGFDVEAQRTENDRWKAEYETFTEIDFDPWDIEPGSVFDHGQPSGGMLVPDTAVGYRKARFTSVAILNPLNRWNSGNPRHYWPRHTATQVINSDEPQLVKLSNLGGEEGDVYWPPVSHIPPNPAYGLTGARHFVIRGQYQGPGDEEPRERYQVVRASFTAGGGFQYGAVIDHELMIEKFLEPRNWGLPDKQMKGVMWICSDETPLEIAPIIDWAYSTRGNQQFDHVEHSWALYLALLVSTGTGSLPFGFGLPTVGENNIPGTISDFLPADQALGIPRALVDAPRIMEAFEGIGLDDALNRVRYAYLEPPQLYGLIESILMPRGLALSLHGGRYGLFRWGLFSPEQADVVITEADLYGRPGDPSTCIPAQELRITGQIDAVHLAYRHDLIDGGQAHEITEAARDAGARFRTGVLDHPLVDDGLMPPTREYGSGWQARDVLSGAGNWEQSFKDLWTHGEDCLAEFYATRHFAVEVTVSRPKGQDLRPGTAVRFSNPWPASNDGTYGLHNRLGRVVSRTHEPKSGATTARILIFGGQSAGVALFAPICRVRGIQGTTVTYYDDFLGHGEDLNDGRGFVMPSWWEGTGRMHVATYIRKGTTWTLGPTGEVASVDTSTNTITLVDPMPDLPWRDKDRILVGRAVGDQDEGSWPTEIYAPVVEHTDLAAGKPFVL